MLWIQVKKNLWKYIFGQIAELCSHLLVKNYHLFILKLQFPKYGKMFYFKPCQIIHVIPWMKVRNLGLLESEIYIKSCFCIKPYTKNIVLFNFIDKKIYKFCKNYTNVE